jgi:hypothetical protein
VVGQDLKTGTTETHKKINPKDLNAPHSTPAVWRTPTADYFTHSLVTSTTTYQQNEMLSTTTPKLKLSRYTSPRLLGERRYSSYSFSTSALDGDEWSAPAAL